MLKDHRQGGGTRKDGFVVKHTYWLLEDPDSVPRTHISAPSCWWPVLDDPNPSWDLCGLLHTRGAP